MSIVWRRQSWSRRERRKSSATGIFGVGADGLILIRPSGRADFAMEMYNADGSPGGDVRERYPVPGEIRL